jgi:hypothetical protein
MKPKGAHRLTGTPRRRRRRRLAAPLVLLTIVLLVAVGLQIYVPHEAEAAIASAVRQNVGTSASVQVQGYFWQLAQGDFQNLRVRIGPSDFQGYRLQSADLAWQDGQVDLGALVAGQVKVLRSGSFRLNLVMNQQALRQAVAEAMRQALPAGASGSPPAISVTPKAITLSGKVTFLDLPVRYRIDGDLVLLEAGQVVAFKARDLNNSVLHLAAVPVLRMRDMPTIPGLPLHVAAVHLMRGALGITVAGPS